MTIPSTTPTDFSTRELYGGAITTTIPASFLDASTVRPVPSTQEVFTSPTAPLSLIFDLLEAQPGTAAEVANTHFSDIADAPYTLVSVSSSVHPNIPADKNGGKGVEVVSIEGVIQNGGSETVVWMAVLRLEEVGTDMVVQGIVQGGEREVGEVLARRAVEGISIVDWNLFGEE